MVGRIRIRDGPRVENRWVSEWPTAIKCLIIVLILIKIVKD